MTFKGQTKPFADSLETTFDINIKDLDIPYYLAYLPLKLNFKIVSAYLDTQTKIAFIQYKDKGPSLTVTGNIALKKVALDDEKKNPLFRLPLLEIGIAPTEPLKKDRSPLQDLHPIPGIDCSEESEWGPQYRCLSSPEKRDPSPSAPVKEKKRRIRAPYPSMWMRSS